HHPHSATSRLKCTERPQNTPWVALPIAARSRSAVAAVDLDAHEPRAGDLLDLDLRAVQRPRIEAEPRCDLGGSQTRQVAGFARRCEEAHVALAAAVLVGVVLTDRVFVELLDQLLRHLLRHALDLVHDVTRDLPNALADGPAEVARDVVVRRGVPGDAVTRHRSPRDVLEDVVLLRMGRGRLGAVTRRGAGLAAIQTADGVSIRPVLAAPLAERAREPLLELPSRTVHGVDEVSHQFLQLHVSLPRDQIGRA